MYEVRIFKLLSLENCKCQNCLKVMFKILFKVAVFLNGKVNGIRVDMQVWGSEKRPRTDDHLIKTSLHVNTPPKMEFPTDNT